MSRVSKTDDSMGHFQGGTQISMDDSVDEEQTQEDQQNYENIRERNMTLAALEL